MKLIILLFLFGLALCEDDVVFETVKTISETEPHDIRWVAKLENHLDNGRPGKVSGRRMPDGTTVFDCVGSTGARRMHSQQYEKNGDHFVYRCVQGVETVDACIGSERVGKAKLRIGENKVMNGFWHRCGYDQEKKEYFYEQEVGCSHLGKDYKEGEPVYIANLILQCEKDGYSVRGCYYESNESQVEMEPDTSEEVDTTEHHCERRSGSVVYWSKSLECTRGGTVYAEGAVFFEDHINLDPLLMEMGCYVDKEKSLGVDEYMIVDDRVHHCYSSRSSLHYESYPCGAAHGVLCSPALSSTTGLAELIKDKGVGFIAEKGPSSDEVPSADDGELKKE